MKKTRVLHFKLYGKAYGGVENYITTNWKFINKDRFAFDLVTYEESLALYRHMGVTDEMIKRVCRPTENVERFEQDMKQLLNLGYDVVQFHTSFWTGTILEELAKKYGIPKIIIHAHNINAGSLQKADDKVFYEQNKLKVKRHNEVKATLRPSIATDFWACSQAAADWIFGERVPAERIKIMKNAIDVKSCLFRREIRDQYRRELGLEGCVVIGNVARLVYEKNQHFLLQVFEKVCQRMKNARLLLVGDGEMAGTVRQQAESLGVADRVILLGNRPDVPKLLQAMDVFCLPSLFEGLGIVLIEAQSAGLKCLASDGVPQEAKVTENLEFLPLEIDLWVEAILSAAEGYERENMYEQVTAAGYNIEQQIKEVERLYLA